MAVIDKLQVEMEDFDSGEFQVFGEAQVPDGYALKCVKASSFMEHDILPLGHLVRSNVRKTRGLNLCRSRSWLKAGVSIYQLMSAVHALWTTRGDQARRFGYAAYGLSVTPYALMSLINLLCNAVMGELPCRYLLRTAILEEAERRKGAQFSGVIGTLKELGEKENDVPIKRASPASIRNTSWCPFHWSVGLGNHTQHSKHSSSEQATSREGSSSILMLVKMKRPTSSRSPP